MPNYYLSVLYKHIIQVENKNVGLKVGGHKHTIAPPPSQKSGGHMPPFPPPLPSPASYASVCILLYYVYLLDMLIVYGINRTNVLYYKGANSNMVSKVNLTYKYERFFFNVFLKSARGFFRTNNFVF